MTGSTEQDASGRHGRRLIALACGLTLALVPTAHARLGDLDPAFDGDGVVNVADDGRIEAVTTRPDGRPVAAGWVRNIQSAPEGIVAQLTNAGAPDDSFGTGGIARVAESVATHFFGVAVDPDRRVLAAGLRSTMPVVVRFSERGERDTLFDGRLPALPGEAHAVVPLAGGMLVGGWIEPGSTVPEPDEFFVARLDQDGVPKLPGGFARTTFADAARALSMAIDPLDRIVLAGRAGSQPALARFNANGTLDSTFGDGGGLVLGEPPGELRAVQVDGIGRITAAGVSGGSAFVTRRLQDGSPDRSFGTGGAMHGPAESSLHGLVLDGARTVTAGGATLLRDTSLLLGSLDAAGTPEPALGGVPPGWRSFPGAGEALGASLGPGGTLYAAGVLGNQPYISRHLPNAAPTAALNAPAQVFAGAPAAFDAGGSSDPEGEQLSYAFDLDGNGTYEFDGGTNPVALRSFPAPGGYAVGVQVTDPRGASATATRAITVVAAPFPPPQPVLGKQGVAKPLRGIVRYRLPGTRRFLRLVELTAIPNGTEIDARKGRLLITVLHDASGQLDGARFYGGRFVFSQGQGKTPITTLTLTGGSFKDCMLTAEGSAPAMISSVKGGTGTRSTRRVRKLWGSGRGRFRTRGRYGAATVRGTKWLTLDRCDGTKVRVVRGKVSVQDLLHPNRRPKLVSAGRKTFIPYKRGG